MTSVPMKALEQAATAVAEVLREKNGVGFFSIEFVAFTQTFVEDRSNNVLGLGMEFGEEKKEKESSTAAATAGATATTTVAKKRLRMWGVQIEPRLTNAASQYNLVNCLCGGGFNGSNGSNGSNRPNANSNTTQLMKSYASLDYLYCPSLMRVQYGSFFKLCRMNAVSFDLETLSGLMFLLFDSLSGGMLGMLAIGDCTADSMDKLNGGFQFLKHNIGSAKMYQEPTESSGNLAFVNWMKVVEIEAKKRGKLQRARDLKAAKIKSRIA